jgi:hypothetical protein
MKALDEVKMLARAQGHENIVGLLSTFQPSNGQWGDRLSWKDKKP